LTSLTDCENRTGGEHQKEVLKLKFGFLKLLENDMPVLGLAGCHQRKKLKLSE
jgi:hypothetical protein